MRIVAMYCSMIIFLVYICIILVVLLNIDFFNTIFCIERPYVNNSKQLIKYSCHTIVQPGYRQDYFGYVFFVLSEYNNSILFPNKFMKVYGYIELNSLCIVKYKKGEVLSILNIKDKEMFNNLITLFEKLFRIGFVILISGGVLNWKLDFWSMILKII